jgi:hypothetical protein
MTANLIDRRLTPKGGGRVQCRRGTLGLGPDLGVRLVEVWPDGAGVLVRESLAGGAEVSLVLEGPGSSPPVKPTGTVARCEAAAGGYLAEVEFRRRLERAELLSLT